MKLRPIEDVLLHPEHKAELATLRARLAAEQSALLTAKGDLAEAGHKLASLEAAAWAVLNGNHACVWKAYGPNCSICGALRAALAPRSERREGEPCAKCGGRMAESSHLKCQSCARVAPTPMSQDGAAPGTPAKEDER